MSIKHKTYVDGLVISLKALCEGTEKFDTVMKILIKLKVVSIVDLSDCIMRDKEKVTDRALDKCPSCGGKADNGFDRCMPPNPYTCSKCEPNFKEGGE